MEIKLLSRIKELENFRSKAENILFFGKRYPYTNILKTEPLSDIPEIVSKLENKLDRLIEHLNLEEYEPDCNVKFRDKEKP